VTACLHWSLLRLKRRAGSGPGIAPPLRAQIPAPQRNLIGALQHETSLLCQVCTRHGVAPRDWGINSWMPCFLCCVEEKGRGCFLCCVEEKGRGRGLERRLGRGEAPSSPSFIPYIDGAFSRFSHSLRVLSLFLSRPSSSVKIPLTERCAFPLTHTNTV
jgi:hypothetical protein